MRAPQEPYDAFPPILQRLLVGAFLGVAFHRATYNVELDNQGWRMIGSFVSINVLATIWLVYLGAQNWTTAIGITRTIATSCLSGLTISTLLHRIIHPLRKFPGPFAARLSKWYSVRLAGKNGQYMKEIEALHHEYGDFVRTGPRELSVLRPSAIALIYGPKWLCSKPAWYSQTDNADSKTSLLLQRDPENHRRRRRLWDKALGTKALATYAPGVHSRIDLLLDQLARSTDAEPVDVTRWLQYLTFDVMGHACFGEDYNMLGTGIEHPAVRGVRTTMEITGTLVHIPWMIHVLKQTGMNGDFQGFLDWCHGQVLRLSDEYSKEAAPSSIMSWLVKCFKENDPSAPPNALALEQDATVAVIAGSDTLVTPITNTLFYLATHPTIYRTLQAHLDALDPNAPLQSPLLDAIINETLRLKPPTPGTIQRQTPPEGLLVDDVWIPGGCIVSVPTWTIQRDKRWWGKDAEAWKPERWLDDARGVTDDGARLRKMAGELPFLPFGRGPYGCAGKAFAYMEMREVIGKVALRFDIELAEGVNAKGFDEDIKDCFNARVGPLKMVFRERKMV